MSTRPEVTSAAEATAASTSGGDIFISYAREDQSFVRRLHDVLIQRGIEPWVDWEDIPPSAEWMEEIRAAIDSAESFVYVLSPHSASSPVCREEADHAGSRGKRIVPLVRLEVDPEETPAPVAAHNWIFFRDADDFAASTELLVRALTTDLDWVRTHTRLLVRAREWRAVGGDRSFLLRGKDLETAERWLSGASERVEPRPTPLHSDYILQSRRAASRSQRFRIVSLAGGLALSLFLAGLAVIQRSSAVRQRNLAVERARLIESRELAAKAKTQLDADPQLGVLFARQSLQVRETPVGLESLRETLASSFLAAVLRGHAGPVHSVDYSSDGTLLATASEDGTARVWEAPAGRLLSVLDGHERSVNDVQFSPDGRLVATAGTDGTARVWEAATGKLIHMFRGHEDELSVQETEFSPDGQLIVSMGDRIHIWRASTGEPLKVPGGPDFLYPLSVAFSPDGRLVLAGTVDGSAWLWQTRTGKVLAELPHPWQSQGSQSPGSSVPNWVTTAEFSPSGDSMVTGDRAGVGRIWDVGPHPRLLARLEGHVQTINTAGFSPDGHLIITSSTDGTARVWASGTGDLVTTLQGHRLSVSSASFSRDGRFALTSGADGTARVWDALTGEPVAELRGHEGFLNEAEFGPDGQWVLTGSSDGLGAVWTAGTGQPDLVLPAFQGSKHVFGTCGRFSPDGRLVVTFGSGRDPPRVWDVTSGQLVTALGTHPATSAEFSPDSRLIVTCCRQRAMVWDATSGEEVVVMGPESSAAGMASFTPDARLVVTGGRLSGDGKKVMTLEGGPAVVWEASTGAEVAVLGSGAPGDGVIQVFDLASGEQSGNFDPSVKRSLPGVVSAAIDVQGEFVATGRSGALADVWDVSTGEQVALLQGHGEAPMGALDSLEFSPDGRYLATAGDDGTARVWTAQKGAPVAVMLSHWGAFEDLFVNSVRFSPNGELMVTAGNDATARVWDTSTGSLLAVFRGHDGPVEYAEFSRDGKEILTTGQDGTAHIYRCAVCQPRRQLLQLGATISSRALHSRTG
jgi:WD40 repeat protein